jgi:P-type Ca2+ transporter type 2C
LVRGVDIAERKQHSKLNRQLVPGKTTLFTSVRGLDSKQVTVLQEQYGKNIFVRARYSRFLRIVADIVKEPMFILLAIACSLYFVLGQPAEGIMMLVAISIVSIISLYQEVKSSRALSALKDFTEPKVTVIRDDAEVTIAAEDLVPGDIMLLAEGMKIPADGIILQENDLSINESIITGESIPVDKHEADGNNLLYQGSTINSGKCVARVTAIGNNTVLGKLGKTVEGYQGVKTLLQVQVSRLVRRLAFFGLAGFLIIFLINFINGNPWATSLLMALTLAMSAVPEEIPVAFSSFMALGAYNMSRIGIISQQPNTVENLGAISVLCLDKTGTITENRMKLKAVYDYNTDRLIDLNGHANQVSEDLFLYGILASERAPFDEMEKAIWEAYSHYTNGKAHEGLEMIYEYPLQGHPPMMTHVYSGSNKKIVAAKGGVERILKVCRLDAGTAERINAHMNSLAEKGHRVIGIARANHSGDQLPDEQDAFEWRFIGLLALYDPPKKDIDKVIRKLHEANIEVKLITGDYAETAINIAGQGSIRNPLKCITGDAVMTMNADELSKAVRSTNVFARMHPDAKMKVIDAIKANGDIVAMTGDGVNDGPALKAANIGIAMGKKGTEIARQAADLVLTDDDLGKIVTAVREGRKIFSNFKKAIRYIISIHIPIILTASLPVLFGWAYPAIFTPIHVIFLELIMGPTCSIFFEKEPVEEDIMLKHPRRSSNGLFSRDEVLVSLVQGLILSAGVLSLYYYFMVNDFSLEQTRNIVFTTLILGNIFLTLTNRSFTKTIYHTIRYKNKLAPFVFIISFLFLAALQFIPGVSGLFGLLPITIGQFWLSLGVAFATVMWFELLKTDLSKLMQK